MGRFDRDICRDFERNVLFTLLALRPCSLRRRPVHARRSVGYSTCLGSAPTGALIAFNQSVASAAGALREGFKAALVDHPFDASLGESARRLRCRTCAFGIVPRGRMGGTSVPIIFAGARSTLQNFCTDPVTRLSACTG